MYPATFQVVHGRARRPAINGVATASTQHQEAADAIRLGLKVLLIMRGVPGSGKTTLARQFAEMRADTVICSADEYFVDTNGVYNFDPTRLSDAHRFCFMRAVNAFERRVSLVIIDNTNTHRWEMKRFVTAGCRHGYRIFFVEPETPWKNNAVECARKNAHGVSVPSLQRMIESFEHNVTLNDFFENDVRYNQPIAVHHKRQFKEDLFDGSVVSCEGPVESIAPKSGRAVVDLHQTGVASTSSCASDSLNTANYTLQHWLLAEELAEKVGLRKVSPKLWPSNHEDNAPENVDVADVGVQVTEVAILLAISEHPRVQDEDVHVERGEYRSIMKRRCTNGLDQSVFVEINSFEDREASLAVLRNCFPAILEEDIVHIYDSCGQDLQWSVNVLLDSGYEYKLSPINLKKDNVESVAEPPIATEEGGEGQEEEEEEQPSSSQSADDNCCVMELSPDMAMQLQQLFGFIFKDIPPDLLEPNQLKVCIPLDFAYNLYTAWWKSQKSGINDTIEDQFILDGVLAQSLMENDSTVGKLSETFNSKGCGQMPDLQASTKADPKAMSSRLKLKSLIEMFPSIDPNFLEDLFRSNDCVLGATVDTVCHGFELPMPEVPSVLRLREAPSNKNSPDEWMNDVEVSSYWELRAEAFSHKNERDYNFKKAQYAYRAGQKGVAYHYAQQGHMYDRKYKDANKAAAQAILAHRSLRNPNDTLDLHGLHVREALAAVSDMLASAGSGKKLKIITGQGKHSDEGPRILPAVINYLKQKKLEFHLSTPGAVIVKI